MKARWTTQRTSLTNTLQTALLHPLLAVAIVLAGTASAAQAQTQTQSAANRAGTVEFASGEVSIRHGNSGSVISQSQRTERKLKGRKLVTGDRITTGKGMAQIRFTDGGKVALYPESAFEITRYRNAGNASKDESYTRLLKGTIRAITGLIGKRRKSNYRIATRTATLGIRGSSFLMTLREDGSLIVTTEQDGVEVCNSIGCVGLTAGETAYVKSAEEPPLVINARADVPKAEIQRTVDIAAEEVDDEGDSVLVKAATASATLPDDTLKNHADEEELAIIAFAPQQITTAGAAAAPQLLRGDEAEAEFSTPAPPAQQTINELDIRPGAPGSANIEADLDDSKQSSARSERKAMIGTIDSNRKVSNDFVYLGYWFDFINDETDNRIAFMPFILGAPVDRPSAIYNSWKTAGSPLVYAYDSSNSSHSTLKDFATLTRRNPNPTTGQSTFSTNAADRIDSAKITVFQNPSQPYYTSEFHLTVQNSSGKLESYRLEQQTSANLNNVNTLGADISAPAGIGTGPLLLCSPSGPATPSCGSGQFSGKFMGHDAQYIGAILKWKPDNSTMGSDVEFIGTTLLKKP